MRKALLYGFALLILFGSVGYTCILLTQVYYQKKAMKALMERTLPDDKFTKFTYSPQEYAAIDWYEDGREMCIHGEMYDVIKTEHKDGNIVLYCLSDASEELLLQKFEDHLADHSKPGKSNNLSKIFKKLITVQYAALLQQHMLSDLNNKAESFFLCNTPEGYSRDLKKPPAA